MIRDHPAYTDFILYYASGTARGGAERTQGSISERRLCALAAIGDVIHSTMYHTDPSPRTCANHCYLDRFPLALRGLWKGNARVGTLRTVQRFDLHVEFHFFFERR